MSYALFEEQIEKIEKLEAKNKELEERLSEKSHYAGELEKMVERHKCRVMAAEINVGFAPQQLEILNGMFDKKVREYEELKKEIAALKLKQDDELQHKELWETRAENVRLKHENYELKEIKFNREAALELQGIENERLKAQLAAAKENNWDVLQDARMWNHFKKMMKEWEVI